MTNRLFLAVPVSQDCLEIFNYWRSQADYPGLRPTARKNLHLTVYFIGCFPADRLNFLLERLKGGFSKIPEFSLNFQKIIFGPFGVQPPRMIWAVFQDCPEYRRLAEISWKTVQEIIPSAKPPKAIPHLTLARLKNSKKIPLPQIELPALKVSRCQLFNSKLTSKGPEYSLLAEFNFNND